MVDRSRPSAPARPRFARPWRVEETDERFLVKDANGVLLAAISYAGAESGLPSQDEARTMAEGMVTSADLLMSTLAPATR